MLAVTTPVEWRGQEWKVDAHRGVDEVVLVRWIDDGPASGWSTHIAPISEVVEIVDDTPIDFPLLW